MGQGRHLETYIYGFDLVPEAFLADRIRSTLLFRMPRGISTVLEPFDPSTGTQDCGPDRFL